MSEIPFSASPFHRWLRRLAVAVAIIAALIVLAWLAVPPIVRSQLESRLTEALGRTTTVKEVAFDPFKLSVTLRNVAIDEASTHVLTIEEIVADVSSASIWHRAPVLDALKVRHPVLVLARDAQGRYNLQDLIDRALAPSDGPMPRFSVNNIEIESGTLTFDDGVAKRKHTLESLGIGIPFLSSLPYETDIKVTPHVKGIVNGSRFDLDGATTPFAERREAALDVDLDGLPLAQYVAYLPARSRYDLGSGALTTRLKVVFVDGKPGERRLDIRGDVRLDDLAVKRRDGSPLVGAKQISIVIEGIDPLGHEVRIASLSAQSPSADVKRLADGRFELAQPLFENVPSNVPKSPASPPDKQWTATIAKATIDGGAMTLSDEGSTFKTAIADVAAEATHFSTKAGETAHVTLAFVSADRIASFKGEMDVEPTLPTASGTFDLRKFSLSLFYPYYKDVLAVEVQSGSVDFASTFALAADGNVKITGGNGTINELQLAFPGAKDPLWRVPQMAVKGVSADTSARKVTIEDVHVPSGALRVARDRDGTLEAARLVKTTKTTGTTTDTQTWTLTMKRLALERIALGIEDRVPQPVVKLSGSDASLVLTDYSNARGSKAGMTLRARIGKSGRVSFMGPIATNPFSLSGQLDASGLDLVPLKSYVEPHVNVTLTSGTVAARGKLAVSVPDNADAKATWIGDVSVTDFGALDRPTSSDLARWKSLTLEGVDVASTPFRLAIGRIGAQDYYARLIVYQDGTVNFARLLTPGAAPEPSTGATQEKLDKDAPVRAAEEALPISIGKIELARGNLNVSDFFIRPNYSANLTDVTGTISAMSAQQAGDIAISARVDRTAPVEVKGRVQPFAKELSLDLAATARDIDLPPLTPYSIKYAGYGIEKGKLTFDVHYQIDNRKLAAENRLVLDQLTFNRERIDSPTATKLPVLLAVSLLKDSRGVIDINLPISGSLDDPQFSMWGLVVQVIVNLIGKAATAPFALLSAAFGGRGEELSVIPFAPGMSALTDDAQKRVDTLGKALADRPGLTLEIGGRADPVGDREALRRDAVETAMKREKMKSLAREGTAPASLDLVKIEAAERGRWLKAAYEEAPIKTRPRNMIGVLQDVPASEMEAMLLADATVGEDAIRLLANARAQAVKDALTAKGIAGERLYLLAPRLGSERGATASAGDAPPTRVDLALR